LPEQAEIGLPHSIKVNSPEPSRDGLERRLSLGGHDAIAYPFLGEALVVNPRAAFSLPGAGRIINMTKTKARHCIEGT